MSSGDRERLNKILSRFDFPITEICEDDVGRDYIGLHHGETPHGSGMCSSISKSDLVFLLNSLNEIEKCDEDSWGYLVFQYVMGMFAGVGLLSLLGRV